VHVSHDDRVLQARTCAAHAPVERDEGHGGAALEGAELQSA